MWGPTIGVHLFAFCASSLPRINEFFPELRAGWRQPKLDRYRLSNHIWRSAFWVEAMDWAFQNHPSGPRIYAWYWWKKSTIRLSYICADCNCSAMLPFYDAKCLRCLGRPAPKVECFFKAPVPFHDLAMTWSCGHRPCLSEWSIICVLDLYHTLTDTSNLTDSRQWLLRRKSTISLLISMRIVQRHWSYHTRYASSWRALRLS